MSESIYLNNPFTAYNTEYRSNTVPGADRKPRCTKQYIVSHYRCFTFTLSQNRLTLRWPPVFRALHTLFGCRNFSVRVSATSRGSMTSSNMLLSSGIAVGWSHIVHQNKMATV